MRLHRFLVPAAAAVALVGMIVALSVSLHRPGTSSSSKPDDFSDLLALKNEAEALVIEHKLPEAHAKYRELFAKAQGRDIINAKNTLNWDLLERAKQDQDNVYHMLLLQQQTEVNAALRSSTGGAATTTSSG